MKIALYQMSPVWENKAANCSEIQEVLRNSLPEVDLLIFPEMSLTGFTMKAESVAEEVQGESAAFFCELSKTYKTAVIGGFVSSEDSQYFNCALYADKTGTPQGIYRKIHPFSYAKENVHYSAGEELTVIIDNEIHIGLTVCYDLRFPELYRLYAKQRVDLLVNIANWPVTRINHWQTLLKARAIENQCFVAGVNRIGSDPLVAYDGHSAVIDPMGNVVHEMGATDVLQVVEINPADTLETRKKFPFLDDLRLI